MELFESEKKVLTLLEQNARMPASKIAKLCHLSPEGVIKVISRLKERKIIQKFNCKVNYSRMGYKLYPVHIKLSKRNSKVINELKNLILNNKTHAWHMFVEGEYDLMLSLKIMEEKDKEEMDLLLSHISSYISEKDISSVLSAQEYSYSFIKKERKSFQTFDFKAEKVNLDESELKLIDLLRKDARMTILELAKKLNTTARIAARAVKNLMKKGVITGFKTKLSRTKLGFQPCIALISFGECSLAERKKLISWCAYRPEVNYFLNQVGKYDAEITFNVSNTTEFYGVIDEMREKFAFIKKITTLIAKEQ